MDDIETQVPGYTCARTGTGVLHMFKIDAEQDRLGLLSRIRSVRSPDGQEAPGCEQRARMPQEGDRTERVFDNIVKDDEVEAFPGREACEIPKVHILEMQ